MSNSVVIHNPLVRELRDQLGVLFGSRISHYMQHHMSGDERMFVNGFICVPPCLDIGNDVIRDLLYSKEHFERGLGIGFASVEFNGVQLTAQGGFNYFFDIGGFNSDFLGEDWSEEVLKVSLLNGSLKFDEFTVPLLESIDDQQLRDAIRIVQGEISFGGLKGGA